MENNKTEPLNKKVDDTIDELMSGGDHKVNSNSKLAINADTADTNDIEEGSKAVDEATPTHKLSH